MPKIKNVINKEILIDLVHKRPAIWDKHSEVYKDKHLKNAAWREICSHLKDDFKQMEEMQQFAFVKSVIRVWSQTRDSWIRTLNGKKLGFTTRPYVYHREMLFLKNVINMSDHVLKDIPNKAKTNSIEIKVKDKDNSDIELETESDDDDDESDEHNSLSINEDLTEVSTIPTEEVNIIEENVAKLNSAKRRRIDDIDGRIEAYMTRRIEDIDGRIEAYMSRRTSNVSSEEDRHLSFFKGIQPTLSKFDDDQVLEFQSGVINLLQNIRKRKNSSDW